MLRSLLLQASESRFLAEHVPDLPFVRRSVRRFMPGEKLEDALRAAEALATEEIPTVLTLLGEAVTNPEEASGVAAHYDGVFETVMDRRLPAQVSVKPTHLGLDLDPAATRDRLVGLARKAAATASYLWVDMEQSRYVDPTLQAYRAAREAVAPVGVCLQANLRRTPDDLEALLPLRPSIRLVKGAYREPPALAWQRPREIDTAFLRLAERLLEALRADQVGQVGIATHDPTLVAAVAARAEALDLPRNRWEVQMLYGIRTDGVRSLKAQRQPVRVLISYGDAWFKWYVRRLAERPANLLLLTRNILPT